MILRSAAASPFGRKVRLAAVALGLDRDIVVQPAETGNPSEPIRRQNPLGKVPTLLLADGSALYDSRVIVEYLDHLAGGGRIIPADPKVRFPALRLQALADGIMDAAILQVYESRWRAADRHEPKWLEYQAGKVERGVAALAETPPGLDPTPHIGQIAVACALGYLDYRFAGAWRKTHPRLADWHAAFAAAMPAYALTAPPPPT